MKKLLITLALTLSVTACASSSSVSNQSFNFDCNESTAVVLDASSSMINQKQWDTLMNTIRDPLMCVMVDPEYSLSLTIQGSTSADARYFDFKSIFIEDEINKNQRTKKLQELFPQTFKDIQLQITKAIESVDSSSTDIISLFTTICQLSEKYPDVTNVNVITDAMSTIEALSEIEKCSDNKLNVNFINVGYSAPEFYIQNLKSDLIAYCSSAGFKCTFNNIVSNSLEVYNIPDISVEQEPNLYFNLDSAILFSKDSCELNPESLNDLYKIFSTFTNLDSTIVITGYSDNLGPVDSRMPLSQCRAEAVKQAAIKFGLSNNIEAIGVGDTQPRKGYDPNTPEGQQANRRVTIQEKG
jgi:outer membrane protein OmpA-like peptidoglycan-associated protein